MSERAIIAAILMHAFRSTGSDRKVAAEQAVLDADALLVALAGKTREQQAPAPRVMPKAIAEVEWPAYMVIPLLQYELSKLSTADSVQVSRRSTPPPLAAIEDNDHDYWLSEDAARFESDLVAAINHAAPAGTCFGVHHETPTTYGYWRIEDEEGTS